MKGVHLLIPIAFHCFDRQDYCLYSRPTKNHSSPYTLICQITHIKLGYFAEKKNAEILKLSMNPTTSLKGLSLLLAMMSYYVLVTLINHLRQNKKSRENLPIANCTQFTPAYSYHGTVSRERTPVTPLKLLNGIMI